MPKGWSKGYTKETHESVKKISDTMRERSIDNFKQWREEARLTGKIPSSYSELTKDGNLAELLGVVLGDGNITPFPRCECLRIVGNSNNIGFAKRYADLIEEIFQKKAVIAKRSASNAFTITIYQKHISTRLDIPTGSRLHYDFSLPAWISNGEEFSIRFLRGLYEAEGSLSFHEPTYTHKFAFSNKNQTLLSVVFDLVTGLGFHPHASKYRIQVSRKDEVQKLADLLQFRHYDS